MDWYWAMRDYTFAPGAVKAGVGSGSLYETYGIGSQAKVSPFLLDPTSTDRLHFSVPTIHGAGGRILGWFPGLLNPLVHRGDFEGNVLTTYNDLEFTMSDRIYHFLRYRYSSNAANQPSSICLVSGEGFRDVP